MYKLCCYNSEQLCCRLIIKLLLCLEHHEYMNNVRIKMFRGQPLKKMVLLIALGAEIIVVKFLVELIIVLVNVIQY